MFFDNTGLAVVAPRDDPGLVNIDSEYLQTHCIPADGGDHFGVSALTFDKQEELLWMGNQGGHVTSYMAPPMSKYTSFQIHATEDVRQIITIDEGIIVLTASTLRYQIRRGIPVYTHMSQNMNEMQCMLQMSPHRILIGGHQDKLIDFNLNICKETMVTSAGKMGCVMLRPHSRFVCAGNPLGRIDMRDPNTLKVEHSIETHTGSLSDFDVQGNLLVTCGFSNRHSTLTVDRFLMVYDLRMMRVVSPMQTVLDPLFLKFIPSISSRLAVVSPLGQIQLLDTIALVEPRISLLQMENPGAMCLTFDISSSGQLMTCGDNTGHIHVFSNVSDGPVINSYSRPCEMPDTPTVYPSFGIEDYNTPLSVIPMPIVPPDIPLASDWPPHLIRKIYRKPAEIDPEIMNSIKMQGPIGYAQNPRTTRRNQVPYNMGQNNRSAQSNSINKSPKHNEESVFVAIPKRYRKVDVKFNKLGSDDFQFDQYNKTGFTGLEATLPNAYCNSMIQVLYHTDALRASLMSHLCIKEFCLSCELGFLFHMLFTSSQNQPCQPGNFLRAFRTVPEASALDLILSDVHPEVKNRIDLAALIQNWNRFILHRMHVELVETKKKDGKKLNASKPFVYKDMDFPSINSEKSKEKKVSTEESESVLKLDTEKWEEESEISKLFGSKQLQLSSCLKCSNEVRTESMLLSCNLIYPNSEPERDEWSFCDILERSLCPQQTTPAWCEKCGKFTPTSQVKKLQTLPNILSINTDLQHAQHKQFWQSQMDKIVAKAQSLEVGTSSSAPTTPVGSTKPCRYGDYCSRPGCRFRHSFDNAPPPAATSNPYCSNNWLPHAIEINLHDDKLKVNKIDENKKEESPIKSPSTKLYRLSAVVCFVNDQTSNDKRNLVALIRVPETYIKEKELDFTPDNRWYLFNDFSISPIPAHEVVWFSLDWKVPCVLYYSSESVLNVKNEITLPLNREVFTEDACIARTGNAQSGITFTPLHDYEELKSGDLIAMDAEFVTLNQEEAELRSDGKMSTVKPSQMSVARITCIRGDGSMEGTPFIDDYISTQEQVVDYLTKFSGIKPGDLDANFSSKHLTTLKSTYTKLRYLQDTGVIFVGHGLKNDFRVINLVVPANQIADTVHLFHLPHHRMVSLRFLAWHFLGMKIQSETHDSIEDARAALQLYKRYKLLESQNKIGEALADLYETGKMLNWKVPEDQAIGD